MYLDALSFLEDERDAFRPFEALDTLTDEQLERPVEAAGGWSGRDLMGHITFWQEGALAAAKDLAVNETSPTIKRLEDEWNGPGNGARMNESAMTRFRALPIAEVRRRFGETAGELRGYLTVVPESRWVKHPTHMEWFLAQTTDHYAEHTPALTAILEAAR